MFVCVPQTSGKIISHVLVIFCHQQSINLLSVHVSQCAILIIFWILEFQHRHVCRAAKNYNSNCNYYNNTNGLLFAYATDYHGKVMKNLNRRNLTATRPLRNVLVYSVWPLPPFVSLFLLFWLWHNAITFILASASVKTFNWKFYAAQLQLAIEKTGRFFYCCVQPLDLHIYWCYRQKTCCNSLLYSIMKCNILTNSK